MRWLISLQLLQQMNDAWTGNLISKDYTQPFRDRNWLQQTTQVQTAEGSSESKACMRDLDDSWRQALHDKRNLGQSKQNSLFSCGRSYSQSEPGHTVMQCQPCHQYQKHTGGTFSSEGQAKSGIRTWPFNGVCHTCRCPLCRGDDSQGHIYGSCMHQEMSK